MKYNYQGQIAKIESLLARAREICDDLDHEVCEVYECTLLDSRRHNGVRQCIDRALHLLDMASYEIMEKI